MKDNRDNLVRTTRALVYIYKKAPELVDEFGGSLIADIVYNTHNVPVEAIVEFLKKSPLAKPGILYPLYEINVLDTASPALLNLKIENGQKGVARILADLLESLLPNYKERPAIVNDIKTMVEWLRTFGRIPSVWQVLEDAELHPSDIKKLKKSVSKVFWKHVGDVASSHEVACGWFLIKLLGNDLVRWEQKYGTIFVDLRLQPSKETKPLSEERKKWLFEKAGNARTAVETLTLMLNEELMKRWDPSMTRNDLVKLHQDLVARKFELEKMGVTDPREKRIKDLILSGYPDDAVEEFKDAVKALHKYTPIPALDIPDVTVEYRGHKIYKASHDDPIHLVFGALTVCCQRAGGVGHQCAIHSWRSPNACLYVVEDPKGKIVAGSWTWRNADIICFDNVEAYKADTEVLQYLYAIAAEKMMEKDETIGDVRVGLGGDDASMGEITGDILGGPVPPPHDYPADGYRDSSVQRSLIMTEGAGEEIVPLEEDYDDYTEEFAEYDMADTVFDDYDPEYENMPIEYYSDYDYVAMGDDPYAQMNEHHRNRPISLSEELAEHVSKHRAIEKYLLSLEPSEPVYDGESIERRKARAISEAIERVGGIQELAFISEALSVVQCVYRLWAVTDDEDAVDILREVIEKEGDHVG